MKNIIKKILMEYVEESDNDYKNLSFEEAKHLITKILSKKAVYKGINLDGNTFISGNVPIIYTLELFSKHDPNVRFDLIETYIDKPFYRDAPVAYKVKTYSEKIKNIINKNKNIDLSDWL